MTLPDPLEGGGAFVEGTTRYWNQSLMYSKVKNWTVAIGLMALWLSCLSIQTIASELRDSNSADSGSAIEFDSGNTRVALVELFSSQGCSSCPPAERWMSKLKDHPQLWQSFVPVVFHVDYWDYLGWRDPYASIKHSQRQRRYQLHGRCKAVYTPGFMVAGEEWTQWFSNPELPAPSTRVEGQLKVSIDEEGAHVRFLRSADNRGLKLNVAVLGFDLVTDISRGENRGKRLPQDFVVLAHREYVSDDGMWNLALPKVKSGIHTNSSKRAVAFWVSHGSDPSPIQATGGWLN